MTGFDALKDKIERNKSRISEIDRERLILTTQIEAYEEAITLLSHTENGSEDTQSRSSRRTSASWAATLFPFIKGTGRVFSTDEILQEAAGHGFSPTRGNVRSQMGAYKTKGWIEAVADGRFRVTDEGRKNLLAADQLDNRLQWDSTSGVWVNSNSDAVTSEDEYAS